MPGKKLPLGPTGERVLDNVIRLRGRISYRELSERLTALGRPIPTLGLSRVERGERRIDADDLVALALALDVSPNALLMPPTARQDVAVALAPNATASEVTAWRWATGDSEFPANPWADDHGVALDLDSTGRPERFRRENRPHDPPNDTDIRDVVKHEREAEDVMAAVSALRARGVSLKSIVGWLETAEDMARLVAGGIARQAAQKGGPDGD